MNTKHIGKKHKKLQRQVSQSELVCVRASFIVRTKAIPTKCCTKTQMRVSGIQILYIFLSALRAALLAVIFHSRFILSQPSILSPPIPNPSFLFAAATRNFYFLTRGKNFIFRRFSSRFQH